MSRPPKLVIPGLNRGAGIPPGYVVGRARGTGKGPAQLINQTGMRTVGIATIFLVTQSTSLVQSVAHSETVSLSTSISGTLSSSSTSLSQISSSLSGAISSTSSLSSAISTVISGSISSVNSRIDSLSAAGGGGVTTFLSLTDTPDTYVGQAAKVVRVNAGETALEFAAGSVDPGQSTSLSQISSSLSGVISTNVLQSTSLSQLSSSLSGAISSTTSLSTAVSTVDSNQSTSLSQISSSLSAEISTDLSLIASLSTALIINVQSVASASTVTPTFTNDEVKITALAVACQLLNWSGSAVEGWGLVVRIKDNGTARALTYDTKYRAMGVALPTTTVVNKTMYLGFIYNLTDDKFDLVSVAQEA